MAPEAMAPMVMVEGVGRGGGRQGGEGDGRDGGGDKDFHGSWLLKVEAGHAQWQTR